MCLATIKKYSKENRVFTTICLLLLVISTLLTLLVHFYGNSRERFVVVADGTQHAIHHIELIDGHMVPDAVSLQVGEYVQFNTADNREHKIGLGGGEEYGQDHDHAEVDFESNTFGVNDAYRVEFKEKGVFDFHDHLHPELFATVIAY